MMIQQFDIMKGCVSCDACRAICPFHAVFKSGQRYVINQTFCVRCGLCQEICPVDCIKLFEQKYHEKKAKPVPEDESSSAYFEE